MTSNEPASNYRLLEGSTIIQQISKGTSKQVVCVAIAASRCSPNPVPAAAYLEPVCTWVVAM